jgi:lipopolysaccharide transport system ATP-binding protein
MSDDVVIRVEGLGKKYLVGQQAERERYTALRDVVARGAKGLWRKAANMARGRALVAGDTVEEFWALKDVSFEVKRGEVLGIIGRNGAGKSTLLKILSRITEPSEGRVTIKGRVASLLEVGTGFHPELTGRENIYLNGAILGMTRAEIRKKFDEIVAFAEVEKFLDTPVKRYSSGMYVRLAFAVAAHLEPEILVVDEVLAVGDAEFQKKCLGKMDEVAGSGRTVLFVSHNMPAISRLSTSVLALGIGKIDYFGIDVSYAVRLHLAPTVSQKYQRIPKQSHRPMLFKLMELTIVGIDEQSSSLALVDVREPISVRIVGHISSNAPNFDIGIALYTLSGDLLFRSFKTDAGNNPGQAYRTGPIELQVTIPCGLLNQGTYVVECISVLHGESWILCPQDNAPAITFSTYGDISPSPYRAGRSPGPLAPILDWKTSIPNNIGPAHPAVDLAYPGP